MMGIFILSIEINAYNYILLFHSKTKLITKKQELFYGNQIKKWLPKR